jgi:UDP-GlcNAc:undecaprenyl-phosphate GlcNAc-1-phosphate transferase
MGGLLGFLFYNFNPASIFMGDSGSLFIGYMLAVYSLQGSVHTEPLPALLILIVVLGLPVVDTCSSMARRYFRGTGLFSPDRDHVHHRLSARFSHRISVLILYGVGMALGMVGVFMAVSAAAATYWIFGLVLAIALLGLRYLAHFSAETQATDSGEAALRSRALKKGLRESEAQAATSTRYSSGSELPTSATLAGQS